MYPTSSASSAKPQLEKPPLLRRSLGLMKPITWFGPMWAFLCGAIASGSSSWSVTDIGRIFLGTILAGPILCGFSQVINDYFDREVDALNEPHRLIPSGLVSTRQVVITITMLLLLGLGSTFYLGQKVALLVAVGLVLAVVYSAPPVRAKRNGWAGNTLVAISYEGLAWMAGHIAFASLTTPSILMAALYSFGTHGIMSINDYKSIAGDRASGIYSIPVLLGPQKAAWLIVATMNIAQLGVIAAFLYWQVWIVAAIIFGILLIQLPLQRQFLRQPVEYHLKFSAIGVSFFVWGMMAAALGVRAIQ
ncbi:MAG: chlorophyll synthase ChlG [Anaerolineales bacterium]|nr:chlorophyll synthase ChlG [Anaerolineales bacterium]MCA9973072.1 chlorophyll synthase ChlG [Anaerolineales bacterium]